MLFTLDRGSHDESKSDGPEEETTVVEPEQGNGESRRIGSKDIHG